jgi:hypothetical protein
MEGQEERCRGTHAGHVVGGQLIIFEKLRGQGVDGDRWVHEAPEMLPCLRRGENESETLAEDAMAEEAKVSKHYTHGDLTSAIVAGLATVGKTKDSITVDDLAPIDEFHIGGRKASEDFLSQLGFSPRTHVLDVGCGLGGAARFVARPLR